MAESRSDSVPQRSHIYRAFDRELAALKRHLREMGELVEAQIAEATRALVERDPAAAALEAFLTQDVAKAEGVLAADADVDRMLVDVFDELRGEARRQPGIVDQCVSMMFFAKHVERLADHATNLAEMVVFLVRGEDVRHATRR
ncbi:hypothetical protein BE04_49415 [Sorangium cellulosum]|uniref:PhoU domain-containing protein n=2 Tax=Sorangium cellulosum TaxID=56 RepID=A0A150P306_SORCE|nr:PhoU domain-containing protein [Sorangium cellulosum]AGP39584.1 hypothetical protein SCE1572_36895 [Sorangium cellulosum So0157-2]KYF49809.1 hypothetical protein BE04_49415 [Sorangium cellulosum]